MKKSYRIYIISKKTVNSTIIVFCIETLKHVDTRRYTYLHVLNSPQNIISKSITQSKYINLILIE